MNAVVLAIAENVELDSSPVTDIHSRAVGAEV
jgi:hypothetical protein